MDPSPKVYVICSDRDRNGKTLLSRLYSEYLIARDLPVRVCDLDAPQGRILSYLIEYSQVFDITGIKGQMAMFDQIMGEPSYNYVFDVPARHLDALFSVITEIGFMEEAHRVGLMLVAAFVVDKSLTSVQNAKRILQTYHPDRLIAVRNEAIGNVLDDFHAADAYLDLYLGGEIAMPALSRQAIAFIERQAFSFGDFSRGIYDNELSEELHGELRDFSRHMWEEIRKAELGTDLLGLQTLGLI